MTIQEEDLPTIHSLYKGWQDGDYTAEEAVNLLSRFIGQVQDSAEQLKTQENYARMYVGEIVNYLGGKVEVKGFGKLEITSPTVSYSYDKKAIDKLTNELRTEGLGDVALRLDACLKPSERAGTLRITREKSK